MARRAAIPSVCAALSCTACGGSAASGTDRRHLPGEHGRDRDRRYPDGVSESAFSVTIRPKTAPAGSSSIARDALPRQVTASGSTAESGGPLHSKEYRSADGAIRSGSKKTEP
jgi:hypothetical protein